MMKTRQLLFLSIYCLLFWAGMLAYAQPNLDGEEEYPYFLPLIQNRYPLPVTSTVIYADTNALFGNPERGFYRYFQSKLSAPNPWTVGELTDTNRVSWLTAAEEATITQIYCLFYLDTALQSDIPADYLMHIRHNLDQIREAGQKCILRFAYSDADSDNNQNDIPDILEDPTQHTEPALEQILSHIAQLEPILQEYADVIAVMQAGFIGIWGEWYYTDHFVDDPTQPGTISAEQYARRRLIVEQLLEALPASRMLVVRTTLHKQMMFGYNSPIEAQQAFQNTPLARIGYHNDAFLSNYGDSGTFPSPAAQVYLQAETSYVHMGGEINAPYGNPPSRGCDNALQEMATYHWSYINTDYYTPALANWDAGNCIHDPNNIPHSILDRLGYRLVLKQGQYPNMAQAGGPLPIQIELANEGFAAPMNPRPLYLVLENSLTNASIALELPTDPRRWLGGQSHLITHTVTLPHNLPSGTYALYLHLPDPHPNLASRPEYTIRLANHDLWESGTGWNRLLHTLTIP